MNITDAQRSDQLRGDARNEQSEKSGGFSTSALAAAAVCAAVSGAGTGAAGRMAGPLFGKRGRNDSDKDDDQCDDFTLVDIKGDFFDGVDGAIVDFQVSDF